jgi:outer membrane protein OmpA-like peptidoglycan-associated protein
LGEYNILGEVEVLFANGKLTIDPQYEPRLLQLAQKAKTINGYVIQVKGIASSVGSADSVTVPSQAKLDPNSPGATQAARPTRI